MCLHSNPIYFSFCRHWTFNLTDVATDFVWLMTCGHFCTLTVGALCALDVCAPWISVTSFWSFPFLLALSLLWPLWSLFFVAQSMRWFSKLPWICCFVFQVAFGLAKFMALSISRLHCPLARLTTQQSSSAFQNSKVEILPWWRAWAVRLCVCFCACTCFSGDDDNVYGSTTLDILWLHYHWFVGTGSLFAYVGFFFFLQVAHNWSVSIIPETSSSFVWFVHAPCAVVLFMLFTTTAHKIHRPNSPLHDETAKNKQQKKDPTKRPHSPPKETTLKSILFCQTRTTTTTYFQPPPLTYSLTTRWWMTPLLL